MVTNDLTDQPAEDAPNSIHIEPGATLTETSRSSDGERTSPDTAASTTTETDAAPAVPSDASPAPDGLPLVLPLASLSPEEHFRATTRLIFLAPDVPPVDPRPRRNTYRQLDDILDQDHEPRGSGDAFQTNEPAQPHGRQRRRGSAPQEQAPAGRRQSAPQRTAPVVTEPQRVKGSTRLEAKKQRRRDGRDAGRRRMVITESEFLARREAVDREMIVRTSSDRIQIGVLEDRVLVEHYVARSSESSLIGNVYLGRVQNVLPSMEAAFVDIGRGRNAVLYSGEVDWSEIEGGNTARKIENALKPGDTVLVQVTKDPVGHKGARLTSQISLPGRFLVYVPGGAMNGISRKLPDTERARLKKILKEVLPNGAGVIVRTAAEGATEEQLTRDVQHLTRQWESIQKRYAQGGGPTLLHAEPDMLIKIVRDVFNEDFQRMVVSGTETHRTIEEYLERVAPDLMERVELADGDTDVFDEYRISEQIVKALDRKVWLPSGGSLVIDRTEAMTVIDVNTGKFVGSGGNLEETVTKNNLEAAEEIVRQLRLRDIGGIIVIDFIDMVLESNRDLVLRRLIECLGRDRTKHQVAEVTSLGLVQMTRKKLGLGLLESFSEPCEVCAGRGVIVHHEPVARHRNEGSRGKRRGGNQPQQHAQPESKAHAITDGAKNMLAQVAASTITPTKDTEDTTREQTARTGKVRGAAAPRLTDVSTESAATNRHTPERAGSGRSRTAPRRASSAAPPAAELLDSVLDALPDAPPAGTAKQRTPRRATSASVAATSHQDEGAGPSVEAIASDAASGSDPQQLILDALDAKAQQSGKTS